MFIREKLFPLQYKCTALFLAFNLAHHQWIDIACYEMVKTTLVCEAEEKILPNTNFGFYPAHKSCGPSEFRKEDNCFSFLWLNQSSEQSFLHLCHRQTLEPHIWKDISYFSFVFDAVGEIRFSVIAQSQHPYAGREIHTYERIWLIYLTHQNQSVGISNLYHVCEGKVKPTRAKKGILFACFQGQMIASSFVIDGYNDCPRGDTDLKSNDEICPIQGVPCPQRCNNKNCSCSPIHYKSFHGTCKTFIPKTIQEESNSSMIPDNKKTKSVNCSKPQASTKEKLQHCPQQTNKAPNDPCLVPGQLPCSFGDSLCYNISDICIYKLNYLMQLIPCYTGSHLQNCLHFECNVHFQCPSFYCIPWFYVYDGVWNCPYGLDEHSVHSCGTARTCKNMLRCRKSQLCVLVSDVCDGKASCPLKDDELLCQISNFECPAECICLNLAIFCQETTTTTFDSYASYYIINSSLEQLHIALGYQRVMRLHCVGSLLVEMCGTTSLLPSLTHVNFAFNKIAKLSQNCFNNLHTIHHIIFKGNVLGWIEDKSFQNIQEIGKVDVSHNNIVNLSSLVFSNVSQIFLLDISQNPLKDITNEILFHINLQHIRTSISFVCCIKPESTTCSVADKVQKESCLDVIPTFVLKVTTSVVALCILLSNIANTALQIRQMPWIASSSGKGKSKPFDLLVLGLSFGNNLQSIYLGVLGMADMFFQKNIAEKERQWHNSIPCLLAFVLCIFYGICVSYFLILISIGRLMVVLFPLKSRFMVTGFIKSCLLYGFTCIIIVSFCLCIPIWSLAGETLNDLCFSFPVMLFIMISQIIAGFVMCVFHFIIWRNIKQEKKKFRSEMSYSSTVIKLAVVVLFNMSCFLSSTTCHFLSISNAQNLEHLIAWSTLFTFSLPAVCNPLFFMRLSGNNHRSKNSTKVSKHSLCL